MSLNWSNVKSLAIPVGGTARDVKRVSIGGAVVWEKPSPLPYDAEVEYLESTGTQWIDTGYVPKANSGVRVPFRVASVGSNDGIFGARTSGGNDRFWIVPSSVGMNFGFGGAFALSAISANTDYTASLNFMADGKATCGASSTNISGFSGCPYPLYIFAANVSGTASFMEYRKRIYGFTITEGSEVVHDYIPVRVGQVGYLYDRVTRKLYGNAGTGDFVLGPDVVPVEYIESHGTEYILLPANNYDGIDIMLEPADGSTYGNIGRRTGTRADTIGFTTTTGWLFRAYSAVTQTNDTNRSLRHATVHGTTATLDGVSYTLANGWNTVAFANKPFALFGLFNPSTQEMFSWVSCKIGACALYVGNEKVYGFASIRVGSGSTWEGAMMDTLTRRIYRNAGTGAFTYGADLPYPIGG